MHVQSVDPWRHEHLFLGACHGENERRTWLVVGLTAMMMVVEIAGGAWLGSMALIADGWHMSTHVAALGIAAIAYRFARSHARDARFTFGTGKLGELAGFASAILLAVVAAMIAYESAARLFSPVTIRFGEAIPIAVLGLAVNVASALLLGIRDHGQSHAHGESTHRHDDQRRPDHHRHMHNHRGHDHPGSIHQDTNFRAAYTHVLADAFVSILAIAALTSGSLLGAVWLDPAIGLIGAVVILAWAWSLLRSSGAVLLDAIPDASLAQAVRARVEVGEDRVADLHLWRLGPGHSAAIVSIVSDDPATPDHYKAKLSDIAGLSHVTVEVHRCKESAATG
jgi:cation diffusion facilitator family transporter